MMYLGNQAVGLNNEALGQYYAVNIVENHSYDTMNNFMIDLVLPLLTSPPNDKSLFIYIISV